MAHIYVGDMVMVRGLTNKQTYNGRLGLVKQLISSVPENKCQIQLSYCGALEDKHLILKTRCLSLVAPGHRYYPESVPCQSMVWGLAAAKAAKVWCPADHQVDQRPWVHRVAAQDSWELTLSKMDVWYYCIRKLAQLIRRGNHIGQAARSFQPRQVRDLHYGYVWSHGGKEQATEFPTSGKRQHKTQVDFPPVIKAVQGIVTPDIAQSACELAKQRALGLIQQVMRWNKPVLGELRAVEEAADAAEKTEEEHFPFSRLAAEHMLVEHSVAISKLQQLEQENSAAISKLQSQLHMLEPGSTPAEESATALGGLLEEQTAVISEKRMQVQPNHLDKTEAAQGGPNPEEAQEAAQTAEHKRLAEATVQKRMEERMAAIELKLATANMSSQTQKSFLSELHGLKQKHPSDIGMQKRFGRLKCRADGYLQVVSTQLHYAQCLSHDLGGWCMQQSCSSEMFPR